MEYNTIHKEYRLGAGLTFKVTNEQSGYFGKWLLRTNIPELDYTVLLATNKEDAIKESIALIHANINQIILGILIFNKQNYESTNNDISLNGDDIDSSNSSETNNK